MKTKNPISVFLVDDDVVYLTTLEHHLHKHLKSKIQSQSFSCGEDCLKAVEQHPTTEVVVLDYRLDSKLPNAMNGLDVLQKLKEINPEIIVVMLTSEDKLEIAIDSIAYGAYEYVVKSETAFIRIQNILRNLIHGVGLRSYYPVDLGGEG